MNIDVTASITINASTMLVWQAVTDIEHCGRVISAVESIEILSRPETGLIGLKWRETRQMFGRSTTEVMWITEAVDAEYYCTRAESHGCVYNTRVSLQGEGAVTVTMSFTGRSEHFIGKVVSFLMKPFMNKSLHKALMNDLQDIKAYLEAHN